MALAKEQDEIFRAALSLPEEIRAVLAERLLESLDSSGQREIEARWGKEAEDRIDAYDRGEIAAFPEAVLPRVKRRFSHIPPGVSLTEELIAERRAKAGREEKE
jgi:hypothetical protein